MCFALNKQWKAGHNFLKDEAWYQSLTFDGGKCVADVYNCNVQKLYFMFYGQYSVLFSGLVSVYYMA